MSTPAVPYVAPWVTGFNRYSTQIYPLIGSALDSRSMQAPEGQWWRIVYMATRIQTSAVAGSRIMEIQIVPGNGAPHYLQPANAVQAPSVFMRYIFAPSITAYSQISVAQFSVSVQTIPDMLWPPQTTFTLELNGAGAGDAWGNTTALAVEIYTEDYNSGDLVPLATPLLV